MSLGVGPEGHVGQLGASGTFWSDWRTASCTTVKKLCAFWQRKDESHSPSSYLPRGRASTSPLALLGYNLPDKDLKKLHKAASVGDLEKVKTYLQLNKHDVNMLDREDRWPEGGRARWKGRGAARSSNQKQGRSGHPTGSLADRSGNHRQRITLPTCSFLFLKMLTWIFEVICVLPDSAHSSRGLHLCRALHPFPILLFFLQYILSPAT